jgi:hypothetical protein
MADLLLEKRGRGQATDIHGQEVGVRAQCEVGTKQVKPIVTPTRTAILLMFPFGY